MSSVAFLCGVAVGSGAMVVFVLFALGTVRFK